MGRGIGRLLLSPVFFCIQYRGFSPAECEEEWWGKLQKGGKRPLPIDDGFFYLPCLCSAVLSYIVQNFQTCGLRLKAPPMFSHPKGVKKNNNREAEMISFLCKKENNAISGLLFLSREKKMHASLFKHGEKKIGLISHIPRGEGGHTPTAIE